MSRNSNQEAVVRICNPYFLGNSENGFICCACMIHKYIVWNNLDDFTVVHGVDPVKKSLQHAISQQIQFSQA